MVVTFIQQRWTKSKSIFLAAFFSYLLFLLVFSTFLGMMYLRQSKPPLRSAMAQSACSHNNKGADENPLVAASTHAAAGGGGSGLDGAPGKISFASVVQALDLSRITTRKTQSTKAFSGCTLAGKFSDLPLCSIEVIKED